MPPTDQKIDKWLRSQDPRAELALRYSIRGRFMEAKTNAAFNARVDELFALLKPDEDELPAILRHAREIGQTIDGHLGEPAPAARNRTKRRR